MRLRLCKLQFKFHSEYFQVLHVWAAEAETPRQGPQTDSEVVCFQVLHIWTAAASPSRNSLFCLACYVLLCLAVWIVNGELSPYSGDEGRSLKLIL